MSTIPKRLGRYELQQQLGRGSVGELWKAYDLQERRDVAVKTLHTDFQSDPNFLNRFAKEGQAITSLHHSNIVQVHEVNVTRPGKSNETTAYIAMDYIEGQTLADYVHATSHQGRFPPVDQIVYLFTTLGVAIDYAHQQGVVHGDLKPTNILLNRLNTSKFEAGEPMISDFGLAQLLGNNAEVASPAYMAPEQAKGQTATNRSDIYSLGIILYEICTGVQPFRDESSVAVMMQHINTLPTPPILINPNIPPGLSEVILRAIAKDTATRFSLASLLATAIADACSMQPGTSSMFYEDSMPSQRTGASMPILGVSQPLPRQSQPFSQISAPLPALQSQYSPAIDRSMAMIPSTTSSMQVTPSMGRLPVPFEGDRSSMPSQRTSSFTSSMPVIPTTRQRGWWNITDSPIYIVVAVLLLLLLIIGGAIGLSLAGNKGQAANGPAVLTGHVFFQDDALGRADVLRIEIQNLAALPTNKSYFAWLQDTTNHTTPLGQLTVNGNSASLLYPGDAQHTNLLSVISGVIITLEDANTRPQTPGNQIVYRAMGDPATLQYIKNILYQTPGLPGNQSAVASLLDAIKSMNDKANSIADILQGTTHDFPLVGRQATRIIELIDGSAYAKSSGDLPVNDPILLNVGVGLLSSPNQAGYIDALDAQLTKLKQAAGKDTMLLQHLQNVENALTDLRDWIQKIRTYDMQILRANNLLDPAAINTALQLKNTVADAYTGRTIPPNPGPLPILNSAGAYQAYVESQYMAALTITQA
ncbi:MAG TPA: serine/threonine-protein kinase [Ktedonosporobacter sp.]|nr:serine/threonine-protein kinase [Ktedonosporobacter sp.]